MSGYARLFLLALAWVLDALAAVPLLWLGETFAGWSYALERRARRRPLPQHGDPR